jgi:hypothetical protein
MVAMPMAVVMSAMPRPGLRFSAAGEGEGQNGQSRQDPHFS